jgi:Thiamine monophosphate kinase
VIVLLGLQILKNKIKVPKKLKNYFAQKYYLPDIQIKLTNKLLNFANSSIDLSDGLIDDLSKMLNRQNLSFSINENKIPISNNLLKITKMKTLKKIKLVSNGDDYQILFTASKDKSRIIAQTSKNLGIKISKIGKICSHKKRSVIIDEKGEEIQLKSKGYVHQF